MEAGGAVFGSNDPAGELLFARGWSLSDLTSGIGTHVRERRSGYVCSNNVGLILERNPDTVLGPDIAVFLDRRKFADLEIGYCEHMPALAVDVLSDTYSIGKIQKRVNRLLNRGIAMVWIVDPEEETLTIFMPNREPIVLERDEEVTGLKMLPDFRCKVADVFAMPGD